MQAAESSFAEICALVQRRQAEVIQHIHRKNEEKRRALEDQLALIESERSLVREQCDQLNSLIDVRSISKAISYLNDKLDTIASLTEPRENAFLRYEDDPHVASDAPARSDPSTATSNNPQPGSAGFVDIARCLAAFGRITHDGFQFIGPDNRSLVQPFAVAVLQSEITADTDDLNTSGVSVLLLDTGNSRLLVADAETGEIKSVLTGNDALKGQAATGMTLCPQGLWIVNWRANELMLLNLCTNEVGCAHYYLNSFHFFAIIDQIRSPLFMEPTSVCYCPHTGRVLVADNGAGCVFACQNGEVHPIIGGGGLSAQGTANLSGSMRGTRKFERYVNDALRRVTGICVMSSGEIVLAAGSELRIYSSKGTFMGTLYAPLSSASLGIQLQPNLQPSNSTRIGIDAEGTCLPSALTQTSTPHRSVSCLAGNSSDNGGLSSTPGSTLTLSSLRHSVGSSLIRPVSSMSGASTTSSSSLRGLFGGVSSTQTSTDLGECLLATHTDRSRSCVIVFPECAWRGAITEPVENDEDGVDNSDLDNGSSGEELGASLMRQIRKQAYALEVEPGLRRLAGLAALPQDTSSSSFSHPRLVAVDLGGQSVHCLRFV
ncbi:unnamed protein product [Rodentolepis nana]|uniref:Uncharacterized protein n=1 Tax=Rodentolepis nana TaxID=102285 RepID=A0A3P7VBU2_RODNA|nr:unnamed protein product [Rodentolepis nana]